MYKYKGSLIICLKLVLSSDCAFANSSLEPLTRSWELHPTFPPHSGNYFFFHRFGLMLAFTILDFSFYSFVDVICLLILNIIFVIWTFQFPFRVGWFMPLFWESGLSLGSFHRLSWTLWCKCWHCCSKSCAHRTATLKNSEKNALDGREEHGFHIHLLLPNSFSLKANWLVYVFGMTLKICKSNLSMVWGGKGKESWNIPNSLCIIEIS